MVDRLRLERRSLRRVMRIREVERETGLRHSSIYEQMNAGRFPKPIRIGPRAVGWLEQEIVDWQEARIAERDARAADAS
jgi:prophage regulatory protein